MITYQAVRRDELRSPAPSLRSSPDPSATDHFRSLLLDQYTFTAPVTIEEQNDDATNHAAEDDTEETELVLFAGPASVAPQSQKIRLRSPDAGTGEPGFVVKRPQSYYFTNETDKIKEAGFRAAAIDAATILAMAKEPWPGCALPWKVKTISATGIKKYVLVPHSNETLVLEEKVAKRRRKGKKSRIALRKQFKSKEARRLEEDKERREKEEAEREKRTRRNREKKVKKKAREKAKKLSQADGGDEGGVSDGELGQEGSTT